MSIDGEILGEVAGGLIDLGSSVIESGGNNRNNNGCGIALALIIVAFLVGLLIYYQITKT